VNIPGSIVACLSPATGFCDQSPSIALDQPEGQPFRARLSSAFFCRRVCRLWRSVLIGPSQRARVREHNSGHVAKHTRLRSPVRLVWSRECAGQAEARALEARLKGRSREKKGF
jgi:hypothetical protein